MTTFVEIPGSVDPHTRLLRPVNNHFASAGATIASESPSFAPVFAHCDQISISESASEMVRDMAPGRQRYAGYGRQQAPTNWHGTPRKGKSVQFYAGKRIK